MYLKMNIMFFSILSQVQAGSGNSIALTQGGDKNFGFQLVFRFQFYQRLADTKVSGEYLIKRQYIVSERKFTRAWLTSAEMATFRYQFFPRQRPGWLTTFRCDKSSPQTRRHQQVMTFIGRVCGIPNNKV